MIIRDLVDSFACANLSPYPNLVFAPGGSYPTGTEAGPTSTITTTRLSLGSEALMRPVELLRLWALAGFLVASLFTPKLHTKIGGDTVQRLLYYALRCARPTLPAARVGLHVVAGAR